MYVCMYGYVSRVTHHSSLWSLSSLNMKCYIHVCMYVCVFGVMDIKQSKEELC